VPKAEQRQPEGSFRVPRLVGRARRAFSVGVGPWAREPCDRAEPGLAKGYFAERASRLGSLARVLSGLVEAAWAARSRAPAPPFVLAACGKRGADGPSFALLDYLGRAQRHGAVSRLGPISRRRTRDDGGDRDTEDGAGIAAIFEPIMTEPRRHRVEADASDISAAG